MFHRTPLALLLACIIAWPLTAVEDSKKDSGDSDPKPPPIKGKWNPVGALSGLVKKQDGDKLTLIVEYPEIQQNPSSTKATTAAQRQMQNFQNQLNAANRIKNPAQRLARIQQIQAQMQAAGMAQAMKAANVKTVVKKKDVDVQLAHEIQVRVKNPPDNFDEKGQPKKYTSDELKKLKGPGNLWGYPGPQDQIRPGATLQVFLYKKAKSTTRPVPKGSLAPKDKDEKKDGDKPKDGDDDSSRSKSKDSPSPEDDDDGTDPLVKVVYVLQESTQPSGTKKTK
jgi:hypothetical protein